MAEERLSGFFYSSLSAGRKDGRAPAHGLSRKISSILTDLSQLRTIFGFFALIFVVKACIFIGDLPENCEVETKCLLFGNGLLAVCRQHVSAQQQSQKRR